jgi:hypothetical protein
MPNNQTNAQYAAAIQITTKIYDITLTQSDSFVNQVFVNLVTIQINNNNKATT